MKAAIGVEPENAHASQFDSLQTARFRVDHGLAVLAALTQPESASGAAKAAVGPGQISLESRRELAQVCGDRIIDRRQGDAEQCRDSEGWCHELPG